VHFFNRIFNTGYFPSDWSSAIKVPIHKKGDLNSPQNYRGISLLDIFGKLFTSVINRRLTFYANAFAKILESQSGFRVGYSTINNAFVLQTLISKILSKNAGSFT